MKKILIVGAGKSSIFLIEYLIQIAEKKHWHITVADASLQTAINKTTMSEFASAEKLQIDDVEKRQQLVKENDLVISMLPPALHIILAKDCLHFQKHFLTASYVDDAVKQLSKEIASKNILFLYEMGLDPGVDHMSAMKAIHFIKNKNGKITSFKSHCGGLVAPESDTNPWHYKISWNPANVVRAGKAGAVYKEKNKIKHIAYEQLFSPENVVIAGSKPYAFYPNRNSLPYIDIYNLYEAHTFIRTTLRHLDFIRGWKNIIALGLTDEGTTYETHNLTPAAFFEKHIKGNGLQNKLPQHSEELSQLEFLGLHDDSFTINKGLLSACDILQFLLEKNLALQPNDKDLIVMLHEIEFESNSTTHSHKSLLVVKGDDSIHTAMAKTVGLPLAIAAAKILEGEITIRGLHIPVMPEIYEPVLQELEALGIAFFVES